MSEREQSPCGPRGPIVRNCERRQASEYPSPFHPSIHPDLYNVRDCFRKGRANERENSLPPSLPPSQLRSISAVASLSRFSSPPPPAAFSLPRLASLPLSSPLRSSPELCFLSLLQTEERKKKFGWSRSLFAPRTS